MLTYAFDLLYAIYEEEGYAPSDIPGLILANNLYGTEIDPRAGALAAFALTMKARARQRTFFNKQVEPNICVLEPISFTPSELDALVTADGDRADEEAFWNQFQHADVLGSLIKPSPEPVSTLKMLANDLFSQELFFRQQQVIRQAYYLSQQYAVVVANPPYMGSRNMAVTLSTYLKDNYPSARQDLYGCFVVRAMELTRRNGLVAVVTGDSWMTIKSFEEFRINLLDKHRFASFLHLDDVSKHADIFGANAAFVVSNHSQTRSLTTFIRLTALGSEPKRRQLLDAVNSNNTPFKFKIDPYEFRTVPGAPISYQLSDTLRRAFVRGRPLETYGSPRQGMATADNNRFLRLWTEVSHDRFGPDLTREEAACSGKKWFPYNKGGEYRKWYGNQEWVVNWERDGRELLAERPKAVIRSPQMYFKPSLSWPKVGSGIASFRFFPQGFLFDVAGCSIFASRDALLNLGAICNSTVMKELLAATSPTLNVEVGVIARMPIIEVSKSAIEAVKELIALHREDWDGQETSWKFHGLELISRYRGPLGERIEAALEDGYETARRARDLEILVNSEVAKVYDLESEVSADVSLSQITLHSNPVALTSGRLEEHHLTAHYFQRHVEALASYAVGCMFGRYSLDEPGLILADQGATRCRTTSQRCPSPSFPPDRTTSSRSWTATGSRMTSWRGSDSSCGSPSVSTTSRRTSDSSPSRSG